jgi:hypothetical protein
VSKRRSAIDPAVEGLVSESDRRQRRRRGETPTGKAQRDAQRTRATYDLPQELIDALGDLAEAEGLSASGAAALLLAAAVRKVRAGDWTLTGCKTPSRAPLFEWVAAPETVAALLAGELTLRPDDESD